LAKKKQGGTAAGQATREELILEAQRLQDENPDVIIGRDFWRQNAKYPEKMIAKYWSRFKDFVDEAQVNSDSKQVEPAIEEADPSIVLSDKYIYNKADDTYLTFLKRAGKNIVLSGDQHRTMKQMYSQWSGKPETINEICRTFGLKRDWFMEYKALHGWTHDDDPFSNEEILTRDEDDMVQDVLQMKKLSLFKKFEKKKWETTVSNAEKWENLEQNFLNPLKAHIEKNLPSYEPPMLNLKKAQEPFAVVLSPFDLHFGKHGWADETGESYSRVEAGELLIEHTQHLADMIGNFGKPELIVSASGSDWFHIDNLESTTTRGTPQDTDGTYTQIFMEGCDLARDHVNMLRQIAPVQWLPVAGNHDRQSATSMMMVLSAYFHKDNDVDVRRSPAQTQYSLYGNSLLGFMHGDLIKPQDAHAVMAKQARDLYKQSEYQYMFTGHLHHEVIREIHGITTIQLKSLSGADRFHSSHGYITSGRALQAFVVSKDRGVIAQLVSPVKPNAVFGVKVKKAKNSR
jgi:predicted phosphodiesterase